MTTTEAVPGPKLLLDVIDSADPARVAKFSALLDRAFQVPPGDKHFLDDFPIWDPTLGPAGSEGALRMGIFAGDELASCAGVRIAELRAAEKPLKIGLIGVVATDERFRGQGLASKLVEVAGQWASEQGASLLLLWGSELALYQRLGFELCGSQIRIPLETLDLGAATAEVLSGFDPSIFQAVLTRSSGLGLSVKDERWYSAHRSVSWYRVPGENGRARAYAAIGRGIDLQGIIHEWGGEPEALRSILARIKSDFPSAALLGSPEELRARGFEFDPGSEEFFALARILDPKAVFEAFHPSAAFQASRAGPLWSISVAGAKLDGITEGELSRIFFGPNAPPFRDRGRRLFPLPLWIWGLDGV